MVEVHFYAITSPEFDVCLLNVKQARHTHFQVYEGVCLDGGDISAMTKGGTEVLKAFINFI